MKPKAQTMAQKFGFMDPELTTPEHDAIMLWLDRTVTEAFAQKTYGNHPDHKWKWGDDDNESVGKILQLIKKGEVVIDPTVSVQTITSKVWECPIVDRTYTIGFADMKVVYAECILFAEPIIKNLGEATSPIRVTESSPNYTYTHKTRYFEVKPTIPSLGEVIRQIRMYQTYTAGAEWWVVSPDARFKDQLESQGIKFLVVPSSI